MKRVGAALMLIGSAGCIIGCTAVSKPVTIQQALQGVERDLVQARTIPLSGTMLSNAPESAAFNANVMVAQCAQGAADPEVPLLQDAVGLKLTGSFSEGASFSITGIEGTALGGIAGSATRSKGQELDIPVAFVVLSEVPDLVAAQRMDRIKALPDQQRLARIPSLMAMHDALQRRVDTLIGGFAPAACTANQAAGTSVALMTIKAPKLAGPMR